MALHWLANSCTAGTRSKVDSSGGGAVVVVQHAAQTLAALDLMVRLWADEPIRQALVIALAMIMGDEVLNGCPQRLWFSQIRI
jgi:hypothetical protein